MHPHIRHAPRGSLGTRTRLTSAALSTLLLLIFGQLPANAAPPNIDSTNWSGVVGRPMAAKGAPLTHVEMSLQIPVLTCNRALEEITIWAGLSRGKIGEANPGGGVNQAGVAGECKNGVPTWNGFWEAFPELGRQQTAALNNLHAGDSVQVDVDYMGGSRFRATFAVSPPGKASIFVTRYFNSTHPADRNLGECIVEAPGNGARPLPKFNDSNGGPFAAVCIDGTSKAQAFVASSKSSFEYETLVTQSSANYPLVTVWSEPGGVVFYQWHSTL